MKDASLSIIEKNVLADVNSLIIHGNEYAIINRIAQYTVKRLFDVPTFPIRAVPLGEDGEYMLSDFHMEFELTDKSLKFIKSIINNKTISNKSFVFIIKYAEATLNRNLFLELRRLIDLNSTSKFIITATSTSFLEQSLVSRCVLVNCIFPLDKIMACDIIPASIQGDKEQLKDAFIESRGNVITFLQHVSLMNKCGTKNNNNKIDTLLLWHKHVDKLLISLKKETNQLSGICNIRDSVYKVYHVGIPLKDICHYVLRSLSTMYPEHNEDEVVEEVTTSKSTKRKTVKRKSSQPGLTKPPYAKMIDFVAICAACECNGLGNKNILSYERLFCEIYRVMLA